MPEDGPLSPLNLFFTPPPPLHTSVVLILWEFSRYFRELKNGPPYPDTGVAASREVMTAGTYEKKTITSLPVL